MKRGAGFLIVMALTAAAWWLHWGCRDLRSPLDVGRALDEGRRVNAVLLFPNRQEALEAAAILSFEPLAGRAVIFNIPTNLCLDGTAEDSGPSENLPATLEAAYARENFEDLAGRLKKIIGPDVFFTAVIPSERFYRLINLMGGLSVNVPTRISFRSAPNRSPMDESYEWIEIPQGEDIFFDAEKTRMYLAYRYDGLGIRGQVFRGRQVAVAFFQRLKIHLEMDWFQAELIAAFTHLPNHSIRQLLAAVAELPASSIDVLPLPGTADLNSGVFWMSRRLLQSSLPKELKPLIMAGAAKSRITVQVLNGSGIPNRAAQLRDRLSEFSDIDIVEMGNADRADYETTQVIDRGGNLRSAERIREVLGTGLLRQEINLKSLLDVTVIIGKDVQ